MTEKEQSLENAFQEKVEISSHDSVAKSTEEHQNDENDKVSRSFNILVNSFTLLMISSANPKILKSKIIV